MATTFDDVIKAIAAVRKATEPIIAYCTEFDESVRNRTEPIPGADIKKFADDLDQVEQLRSEAVNISEQARDMRIRFVSLTFK